MLKVPKLNFHFKASKPGTNRDVFPLLSPFASFVFL